MQTVQPRRHPSTGHSARHGERRRATRSSMVAGAELLPRARPGLASSRCGCTKARFTSNVASGGRSASRRQPSPRAESSGSIVAQPVDFNSVSRNWSCNRSL